MSSIYIPIVLLGASIGLARLGAQPLPLAFKPIDVQHSKSLDRLVMISANPNRVHLMDPASGAETTINLSLTPLSLSVSPDGTHAAVGHDGWISYVNLLSGYVEKNLAVSLTANLVLLAGNGNIWVPPTTTINVATGLQAGMSGYSPWGVNKPALHPNGNWIYYTRGGSPDDVIKGDISSGTFQYLYDSRYHGDFPICAGIFYSADGNRLLTGCGTLFRTTASSTDDITYNGALSAAPLVTAAADSAITHEFVVIPGVGYYNTPNADTEIQFYDDQYLTLLGRVALPKYTSGSVTAPWRGRQVFYSPDASKLYLVLQADATANLVNDYAIYPLTLSTGSGCGPSLAGSSTNVLASGGAVDVTVTATIGCLWQASSNATWLAVGAGGVSSGSGTVTIQAAPNLQTVSRTGTVTIAGLTYTVTQNAAAAPGTNPITASPVRPVAADYSTALDRMILVSTNPDLLTIFDPVTGNGQTVALVMPPTALSISTDGLHAAVGHDGRISYVNLANATVEKTLPVTETVYELALGPTDIYAFPLRDQWEAVRVVNIASGTETLWNWIYAGSTAGNISPNGKYLYINASKRYDITQPLASAFDAIIGYNPRQWFSQDGSRLFSGSGQVFRLSDVAAQDLQYNGTLVTNGLTAVADSSLQQVTATVATGSTTDTTIKFFGQQYLSAIGGISIPQFTVGSKSYDAHGRYLFWNTAGNRLFAVVQADQTSGLLNDFAIYTVSVNGGCHTSLGSSTANAVAAGGNSTVGVTADAGCAWKATSNVAWLTISANAFSAGPATVTYFVDANPTTSARIATITVDGKTLTVTQAAGTQAQVSAVNSLPFRVADAEYSNALDRIVALSGSPSRLNIYNPATGANLAVALPLPGNAVTVQPSGLRAAVCHDGLVSIVNLQTATIEKTLNVSLNCYDVVFGDNGYVYMSATGGWGTSSSVNVSTGIETRLDLYYNGINFRLNATGDAVYTSNTGTSGQAVTRYAITGGPMTLAYQSEVYPAHALGYKVWFTLDGRIVGDAGTVFRTGSTLATDFIYTGTLSGFSGYGGALTSIAHSTTRHLFASVGTGATSYGPPATDVNLFLHGDKYFAVSSKMTLPKITIGGVSADSHGKFVFWDSAGAKAYVIMQADSSAGFLNDFAVYTLSPAFTPGCAVSLGASSGTAIAFPDTGGVAVNAASDCVWDVKSNASWIQIDSGTLGVGIGNVAYSVLANGNTVARTGTITIGAQTFTITQAGVQAPPALRFVHIPPCRIADTRNATGAFGGPQIAGGATRDFTIPSGACGVPLNAQAYSLNVAVVPAGPLGYVTVWPKGQTQPVASTINSPDGRIKSNAAIVPAGASGAISVFASNATHVVLDINGYFVPASDPSALAFYPMVPCRVADTRNPTAPLGGPTIAGGQTRSFQVLGATGCNVPGSAQAYSLNLAVIPKAPLGYLTAWATGQTQPVVASLNALTGTVTANAAIVPAGAGGSIDIFASNATDLVIDINGYFAPISAGGLSLYNVTPCRATDTRQPLGSPPFGGKLDMSLAAGACPVPAAPAYVVSATVVPSSPLGYLTLWAQGQGQPLVSTLNAVDGSVASNLALVPATSGSISAFASSGTHLVLDIFGYFAP
jgi:hypothetical protein